jgi:uncharacterized integral membrane protein
MRFLIAVALILSLLVTIFAVQNNESQTVEFLFWSVSGSSALVLMITLILGIVIGVLLMIPGTVRNRLKVGELQRSARSIEAAIEAQPPIEESPAPEE